MSDKSNHRLVQFWARLSSLPARCSLMCDFLLGPHARIGISGQLRTGPFMPLPLGGVMIVFSVPAVLHLDRLWREHGRLEQRQAPSGAGAWPGALAAGSWPLASGSARCACSSQPQAVCFGQQAGRHDALRRAEGELPGCRRRAAPAEPPGPSAAPDSRAEAESTKHAAF